MQIKTWLIVVVGDYLTDFIFLLAQYHHIKQTRKESAFIIGLRFVLNCFLVCWLIYGNTVYYRTNLCEQTAYNLWVVMFLVLLIGYFEMLKCCCIGSCICIMVPIFIFAVRRAQRPNWMPASNNFIERLAKQKFNADVNVAFDQCAICLVEFTPQDEIIPLPCDEKHYFHTPCISEWLKNNNICPLCKKPITEEDLDQQRRRNVGN